MATPTGPAAVQGVYFNEAEDKVKVFKGGAAPFAINLPAGSAMDSELAGLVYGASTGSYRNLLAAIETAKGLSDKRNASGKIEPMELRHDRS